MARILLQTWFGYLISITISRATRSSTWLSYSESEAAAQGRTTGHPSCLGPGKPPVLNRLSHPRGLLRRPPSVSLVRSPPWRPLPRQPQCRRERCRIRTPSPAFLSPSARHLLADLFPGFAPLRWRSRWGRDLVVEPPQQEGPRGLPTPSTVAGDRPGECRTLETETRVRWAGLYVGHPSLVNSKPSGYRSLCVWWAWSD
jgi:hypothetical protein